MKLMKRYAIGILPLLFFIGSCISESADQMPAAKPEEKNAVSLEIVPVKKSKIAYTLSLPGELHPYEEVKLYAKVKGFVKKLYVDRGSYVKKGQLLATLDAPEIVQQYLAAKAKQREVNEQLQYSLQAYHRMEEAAQKAGAVAAIELDKAHAQLMRDSASYLALQAEVEAADQLKNYTYIIAPFDGVITSRQVSQGALVGENNQPLFLLAQQDRLRLAIAVPEKHAYALQDSTAVTFTVIGRPGEIFKASVSRSSKTIDPSLRSLMVEFDVNNQDQLLSGGEYTQVHLKLIRQRASWQVPASSIVHAKSGVFVVKIEDQVVQRVPVETGIRQDSLVEVFGNLQEGDLIAVNGSEELREGMKVSREQLITQRTAAKN